MGIGNSNLPVIMAVRQLGAPMTRVLTLGCQTYWPTDDYAETVRRTFSFDRPLSAAPPIGSSGRQFFLHIGAGHVDEMDVSTYEGASLVHDMNLPIPDSLRGQYDLLFDGGTIEHVFDVRQTFANISSLVRPGGVFVSSTVANNILGHGFYQFSPELMFRYFCPDNGWDATIVMLCEHQLRHPTFWLIPDPATLGRRIEIQNSEQLYILTIARRSLHSPAAPITPQQSDYSSQWQQHAGTTHGTHHKGFVPHRLPSRWAGRAERLLAHLSGALLGRFPSKAHRRFPGLHQYGISQLPLHELARLSWPRPAAEPTPSAPA
jgi:SAM-dependent methyltransferase